MAPSSGGTCSFKAWRIKQWKRMNEKLHASLGVSLLLPPGKPAKCKILGDLGPLVPPTVCSAGRLQIVRRIAERYCKAILAGQSERRAIHVECCRLWLLRAHSLKWPISSCWMENCSHGVPVMDSSDGNLDFMTHPNSEGMQEVDHVVAQQSAAVQATSELGTANPQTCAQNQSLTNVLNLFGMPHKSCLSESTLFESVQVHCNMPLALSPTLRSFGFPHTNGEPDALLKHSEAHLAAIVEQFGQPAADSGASLHRFQQLHSHVRRGDAIAPFLYATLASLQTCFAYLQGTRVGEASRPGPSNTEVGASLQVKHDPS